MNTHYLIDNYKSKHCHPVNRLAHAIGIPMIVAALPLFFFNWRWALAMFGVGWVFQFIGHAIEGNQPAFFRQSIPSARRAVVAAASRR